MVVHRANGPLSTSGQQNEATTASLPQAIDPALDNVKQYVESEGIYRIRSVSSLCNFPSWGRPMRQDGKRQQTLDEALGSCRGTYFCVHYFILNCTSQYSTFCAVLTVLSTFGYLHQHDNQSKQASPVMVQLPPAYCVETWGRTGGNQWKQVRS